jgi:hypothetical protein
VPPPLKWLSTPEDVEDWREHFRRFPCVAKNVIGFCLWKGPFGGHFRVSPNHGRSRSFSARKELSYYAAADVAIRVSVSR